jgi:hypothetical protein
MNFLGFEEFFSSNFQVFGLKISCFSEKKAKKSSKILRKKSLKILTKSGRKSMGFFRMKVQRNLDQSKNHEILQKVFQSLKIDLKIPFFCKRLISSREFSKLQTCADT